MLIDLNKTKTKKKFAASAAAAAILIIGVVLIQLLTPGIKWFFTPKARAKDGIIESVAESEHIKNVPKGEIKYLINNSVAFKDDSSKGNFMFENPESCEYTLQFSVYQVVGDGNEENLLYTSPMIAPGQYVIKDKLDKELTAGEYACMYFARAYLDGKYVGERSGDMVISVSE